MNPDHELIRIFRTPGDVEAVYATIGRAVAPYDVHVDEVLPLFVARAQRRAAENAARTEVVMPEGHISRNSKLAV